MQVDITYALGAALLLLVVAVIVGIITHWAAR